MAVHHNASNLYLSLLCTSVCQCTSPLLTFAWTLTKHTLGFKFFLFSDLPATRATVVKTECKALGLACGCLTLSNLEGECLKESKMFNCTRCVFAPPSHFAVNVHSKAALWRQPCYNMCERRVMRGCFCISEAFAQSILASSPVVVVALCYFTDHIIALMSKAKTLWALDQKKVHGDMVCSWHTLCPLIFSSHFLLSC